MTLLDVLLFNSDVKLNCPECYDQCYEDDCPTHCCFCGCSGGGGTVKIESLLTDELST